MKSETNILNNQKNKNNIVQNNVEYNENKFELSINDSPLTFKEINSPTLSTNNAVNDIVSDVKNNWNKKYPAELKPYFTAETRMIGDNVEYFTKPLHKDSYEKFPLTINYNITVEKKDGINNPQEYMDKLLREAEKTGKPVEVKNINYMCEKLGKYNDPLSPLNQYDGGNIKLFIMPREKEKKKFIIDLEDVNYNFKIESEFTLTQQNNDVIFDNNTDSKCKFFVEFKISDIDIDCKIATRRKFNIKVELKEEYKKNLEENYHLMIFKYLIASKISLINIVLCHEEQHINLFKNQKVNANDSTELIYLKNTIELLKRIIYIGKLKQINIEYDYSYFVKESEMINLLYNEINDLPYEFIQGRETTTFLESDITKDELMKYDGKLALIFPIESITLFGISIKLKPNKMIMADCEILNYNEDNKEIKFRSYKCRFELNKNNDERENELE